MSKEVERYTFVCDIENEEYVLASDYEALLEENQRLESAWKVDVLNRKDELIAKQEKENDRVKAERDALLAERDRLRETLKGFPGFLCGTATGDKWIEQKRAALQGEQP